MLLTVLGMLEGTEGDALALAEPAPYFVIFRRLELRGEGSKLDILMETTEGVCVQSFVIGSSAGPSLLSVNYMRALYRNAPRIIRPMSRLFLIR